MNIIERIFAKASFYYMSKGLDKLFKVDDEVKTRFEIVPEGTKFQLAFLGETLCLNLQKCEDGFICLKNKKQDIFSSDLTITLKFFKTLPKIVFGASSVTQCYLSDEFFVQGELRWTVAFVFALEKFMAYILPNKRYKKAYGIAPKLAVSKAKMFKALLFAKRRIK